MTSHRKGPGWDVPAPEYGRALPRVTINLLVHDVARAAAFLHTVLEAEVRHRDEDFAAVRLRTDGPVDVWVVVPTGENTPEDVVQTLSHALLVTAIPPGQLTLEITETTLLSDTGATSANLGRLRRLGVKLSIDDFGTGHSSLSQLQQTDVDVLKIDQSFVALMDQDESSAAIVSAIITLGHALGLTLVAEGVERRAQADLLREQGCDAAQGWLFGRPLPAEALDRAFGVTSPELSAG